MYMSYCTLSFIIGCEGLRFKKKKKKISENLNGVLYCAWSSQNLLIHLEQRTRTYDRLSLNVTMCQTKCFLICCRHKLTSCLSLTLCPPSCRSCVRGWSRRRRTGRSCRRSCAGSGRRGKSWSAQSPSSSSRWPSLAQWEAAPLLLLPLPPDPLTPTPRPPPPLPLSQRPQRLAKSNCHPTRCLFPLPHSSPNHPPTLQKQTNQPEAERTFTSPQAVF